MKDLIKGLREHPEYIPLAVALLLFLFFLSIGTAVALHDLGTWLTGG